MFLREYVPSFILESKTFQELYKTQQLQIDTVNNEIQDIINQSFIETATWGLTLWELFLGVSIDETKPYEYRRSVIKAKIRGLGTVTSDLVDNVAQSYTNGEVEIVENVAPYTFEIRFTSIRGIPPNIEDLKSSLEQIKPAHLACNYKFLYTLCSEIINWGNQGLTCDILKSQCQTCEQLKTYKY